jgi:predicted ester cyclase
MRNFGELRKAEVPRIPLPRTPVNRERGGAPARCWRRLSHMEASAATHDPTLKWPPAKLLREPLFWASAASFVGVVVGLAGTFSIAAWFGDASIISSGPPALADVGPWGYILAALSLLGVPALLGGRSRALRIGTALHLVWLAVELAVPLSSMFYPSLWDPKGLLAVVILSSVAIDLLGSAAVLSLALGAFFSGARRLGALLLILGVPGEFLFIGAHYALTGTDAISQQLAVTTTLLFGAELGVAEACLFTLLGVMLLRGARGRALAKAERLQAEGNGKKALRLYEVGLGKNDPSVVEEVVSNEFRDPRRSVSGKRGMRRICADLWATYPDLEVSVEGQEAEGDVVRTRLVLSGTDRSSGVMWYPPTGRWVSFETEFTDRFRRGELVEHTGRVDTEGLLRQLGHHREG